MSRSQTHPHLPPDRARAFLGLIRAGDTLFKQLDESLLRQHGMGLRAFEVLLFLAAFSSEGRLRMAELNAGTPLSQSRVSRLVADMERSGWVRREPAPDDGRGVAVSITDAGRERFTAAQRTHLEDLDRLFFGRLSATELRQLDRITAKLLGAE